MATVINCHYEAGAGQALAFGIPRSRHFQITFNYWAHGELHMGEFASSKAVPQGTLLPITYDPEAPHEHLQTYGKSTIGQHQRLLICLLIALLVSAILLACISKN